MFQGNPKEGGAHVAKFSRETHDLFSTTEEWSIAVSPRMDARFTAALAIVIRGVEEASRQSSSAGAGSAGAF